MRMIILALLLAISYAQTGIDYSVLFPDNWLPLFCFAEQRVQELASLAWRCRLLMRTFHPQSNQRTLCSSFFSFFFQGKSCWSCDSVKIVRFLSTPWCLLRLVIIVFDLTFYLFSRNWRGSSSQQVFEAVLVLFAEVFWSFLEMCFGPVFSFFGFPWSIFSFLLFFFFCAFFFLFLVFAVVFSVLVSFFFFFVFLFGVRLFIFVVSFFCFTVFRCCFCLSSLVFLLFSPS